MSTNLKTQIVTKVKEALTPLVVSSPKFKIDVLNAIKEELTKISPIDHPVDTVQWVPAKQIHSNDYNPNTVAPPEMRLLTHSILMDGYTQPIVVFKAEVDDAGDDTVEDRYIVVDGFHRYRVGTENKQVRTQVQGYLPIVVIDKPISDRMASTIRHNRARGKHGVKPMSEVVGDLIRAGWADSRIAKELGMEADEVLRLKQRKGLPDLFKDQDFSRAWVEEKLFAPLKELKSKTADNF